MAGLTNRAKYRLLEHLARGTALPATFYVALVTADVIPTCDTLVFSELVELAAGAGYTSGGTQINRDADDFDVLIEDQGFNLAYTQLRDLAWLAAGFQIPVSGNGAHYAVMLDDNPVVASREVWAFWDLGGVITIPAGQQLLLEDCQINAVESVP